MSDAARRIRGILAVGVLTAGVTWLTTSAAEADVTCEKSGSIGVAKGTISRPASICDLNTDSLARTAGRLAPAPAAGTLGSARELARRAGLPGLEGASGVLSLADGGGTAAGTVASALPGLSGTAAGLPVVGDLPKQPLPVANDVNLTSPAAPAAPKAPAPKAPDSAVPALNTVEDVVSDLGATDDLLPGELAPGLGLH
ncbi:hypothetical protein [Streptosporangium sp. KLBMP 9127]|nr:hypothetical protein [Streptosporangium sp. KLBMP 9127]